MTPSWVWELILGLYLWPSAEYSASFGVFGAIESELQVNVM